jgi:predicted nucleotidyltransferase
MRRSLYLNCTARLYLVSVPVQQNPASAWAGPTTSRNPVERGGHHLRLFGSVARGEDDSTCDVDVPVDMDYPDRSLLGLVALSQKVDRKVDEVTSRSLHQALRADSLRSPTDV